jgi:hypothetical protein
MVASKLWKSGNRKEGFNAIGSDNKKEMSDLKDQESFGLDFTPMMLIFTANVSDFSNSTHTEKEIQGCRKRKPLTPRN